MHYIIGTILRPTGAPQSTGHKSLSQFKLNRKRSGPFLTDREYELFNIRKRPEEKYKYFFKDQITGDITELSFDSTIEADRFISNIRGEELPNYEKFYD